MTRASFWFSSIGQLRQTKNMHHFGADIQLVSSAQIVFQITYQFFNLNHYFIRSRHHNNMLIKATMLMESFGTKKKLLYRSAHRSAHPK
jgi:hypothetical protein